MGEASRVQRKFREKQHYPLKHQTNIDFSPKGLLRRPQRVNIWWAALKFQSSLAKVTFYKQEWCLSQQTCPPKPARCGQRWSSFPQPLLCPQPTAKRHSPGFYSAREENPPAWCLSKKSKVPVNPLGRWKRKGKSGHFLNRADSSNTLKGRFLAFQPMSTHSIRLGPLPAAGKRGDFVLCGNCQPPKAFRSS